MPNLFQAVLAATCLSTNLLCAQSGNAKTEEDSKLPSAESADSDCSFTGELNWSWISCRPNGDRLIPLEEKQVVLTSLEGEDSVKSTVLVFTGEKSSSRVPGNQEFTIRFHSAEKRPPIVTISRLRAEGGVRKISLEHIGRSPSLRWTVIDQTAVHVSGVDPLPPGEYVVLIGRRDDIKNGDEAFFFGVD